MAQGEYRPDYMGAAVTCPAPMTRAALITLRNSGGLVKDCDYVITDHIQGRLIAGTQIHLQAVSATELSENVSVNTTYDNEAWLGIYDLDRGLVLELNDNRMNIARGINGTEVSNFDWGNANITDTTVDSSTWTSTIGSPRIVNNLTVEDGSTLNTTGWASGSIQRVRISSNGGVTMTNASVSLTGFTVNKSSVNLGAYTGGSNLINYSLDNASVLDLSSSSSSVTLQNVSLRNSSTLFHSGVSTGTVTGNNLIMDNNSIISRTNGSGNLSLNRVILSNNGRIFQSQGTIALADYTVTDGAVVQQAVGVGGNINLNAGRMSGASQITNQSALNFNCTRFYGEANAIIVGFNGAVGTVTLTGTKMYSSSQFSVGALATAGNINITNSTIDGSSILQKNGTGPLTISDTRIDSQSRVTTSNTRGLTLTRGVFSQLSQIIQSGTGAVSDMIIDSAMGTRAVVQFTSSGAASNVLNYLDVGGLGTSVNVTGTTTGTTVNRMFLRGATVNFTNNVIADNFNNIEGRVGGTITFQNMTVAKNPNNFIAENAATININNPTGAGNITQLKSSMAAGIIVTGPSTVSNTLDAFDGGIINQNGGSSTRITKIQPGTLTTGNFTHNVVLVMNNASNTLTAGNSAKSAYLGVVSSTPLI